MWTGVFYVITPEPGIPFMGPLGPSISNESGVRKDGIVEITWTGSAGPEYADLNAYYTIKRRFATRDDWKTIATIPVKVYADADLKGDTSVIYSYEDRVEPSITYEYAIGSTADTGTTVIEDRQPHVFSIGEN